MENIKEMILAKKRISNAIKENHRTRLHELLESLKEQDIDISGLKIEEITKKIAKKSYVTKKDTSFIYGLIKEYRKKGNDLICIDNKYGFGDIKQTSEYFMKRDRVIDGFIEGRNQLASTATKRLGIDFPEKIFIEHKKERNYIG